MDVGDWMCDLAGRAVEVMLVPGCVTRQAGQRQQ